MITIEGVRTARNCDAVSDWGKEFPGRWGYSDGIKNHAWWTWTRNTAPPTYFRHRKQKPSWILGSAEHTVSRPQVLHCTLLRSKPTSCKKWMAIARSQNKNARNILFGPPSACSIGRPYDDRKNGIPCTRFSYSATTIDIFHHFLQRSTRTQVSPARELAVKTGKGSVMHFG